jgi:hypothetical protein
MKTCASSQAFNAFPPTQLEARSLHRGDPCFHSIPQHNYPLTGKWKGIGMGNGQVEKGYWFGKTAPQYKTAVGWM